jgi:NADPH:quinone reductase-like Zn-dependent oxidoreductase
MSQVRSLQGGSLPGKDGFAPQLFPDGPEQLCPDVIFAATPPTDGTLARYYRLPSDLAYPLPPNLSLEDGAMVSGWPYHIFLLFDLF